jgi:hypothetical protein
MVAALADMDAIAMASALTECEAAGIAVEAMTEARDVLGLPRPAFLRRELSTVLATLVSGGGRWESRLY